MTSWRIGYLVVPAGTPSPIGRLQQAAVAPRTGFGPAGEGWVRLPLATDTDALLEGAHRLAGFALT